MAVTPADSNPSISQSMYVEFTSFEYQGSDKLFEALRPSDSQFFNPIIPGFYPDPSICRVGSDYYLVNSSFSFFPGVPIFHSKDLLNWKQMGHVLDRPSQLNLQGLPVSDGIYAPAITFHDGLFYVITTNVHGIGNFYVTARNPAGPWSDPVQLQFDGIDPSFFFDDDGKVYVVHNNTPIGEPLYDGHRAIWLWNFDPKTKTVHNGRVIVNGGADISKKPSWIEGPHIFKRNGWYYLSCAEGGTGPKHSQVIFRTRSLDQPFEPAPHNPILTQRDLDPKRPNPVIALGHADMVETANGDWWAVFLGVRPYQGEKSNIGRETFMLPVKWDNDWPVILNRGDVLPRVVERPEIAPEPASSVPLRGSFTWTDRFDSKKLDLAWLFLRTPSRDWWSLTQKPGSLLISPQSVRLHSVAKKDVEANGNPSFIARRQQHHDFSASTTLSIEWATADSEAGLAALQNDTNYLFLGVRIKGGKAREIFLEKNTKKSASPETVTRSQLPEGVTKIELRMEGAGKDYALAYRTDKDSAWIYLAEKVDGSILSTQVAGGFVGTVVGMHVRTLTP